MYFPSKNHVAGFTAVTAAVVALANQPALKTVIGKWLGLQAPGGVWRIIAIVLAILNLKNLPFIWHVRVFRAFFYQLYFQPTPIRAEALFQPVVSSTRTPLTECDWNGHKSNSTYFSDLDVTRTHLFSAIFRRGILESKKNGGAVVPAEPGKTTPKPQQVLVALGGVSCSFKREIKPYQKYEMWTRVLCWDRKWIYLVTHMVKPGIAKPSGYTLQPWKRVKGSKEYIIEQQTREKLNGAVLATSIAKYVCKRGRITVPAEEALTKSGMLPPKPEGWEFKGKGNGAINGVKETVLPKISDGEEWNWDTIEAERLRGLRFAEGFANLDGLHEEFEGGKNGVLGEFPDLLF